jgi:hypothetical protein
LIELYFYCIDIFDPYFDGFEGVAIQFTDDRAVIGAFNVQYYTFILVHLKICLTFRLLVIKKSQARTHDFYHKNN